ncbi:MAG: TlpA family protein disulfide reductase, partial [Sphingobacteriaceae bacterium]
NLKGLVLQGLVKTGLYKPDIDSADTKSAMGKPAPSVLFQSSSGEKINISEPGDKVIFLNLWATWCPPCIAEMPSIQALKNKVINKDGVVFLMADVDSDLKKSVAFMQKKKYTFDVYAPASTIPETLFSGTIPTTVIINKEGKIVFQHEGMADYDSEEMVKFINDLAK